MLLRKNHSDILLDDASWKKNWLISLTKADGGYRILSDEARV